MLQFVAVPLQFMNNNLHQKQTRVNRYPALLAAVLAVVLTGCMQEDPNILNPPAGASESVVRLLNLVPDGKPRKLVMEQGYQTASTLPGSVSAAVTAPTDSGYIEIVSDAGTEYKSQHRIRFVRNSTYDVLVLSKANGNPGFDTVIVSNANKVLTTVPTSQLRVINAFPDSNAVADVRLGCLNGVPISSQPLPYRGVSLYREVAPGTVVISAQTMRAGTLSSMGTFEVKLDERTPYSLILYQTEAGGEPQLMLINEDDHTATPTRNVQPVTERSAFVRLCNLTGQLASAELSQLGAPVAANIPAHTIAPYISVPSCVHTNADVITLTLANGLSDTDSTAIEIQKNYTLIAIEKDNGVEQIIVPPLPVLYQTDGQAILRVVNGVPGSGRITVSSGARTSSSNVSNVSSGVTLATNIGFTEITQPVVLAPGVLPLTVTTASTPTTILNIGKTTIEPGKSYTMVITQRPDATLEVFMFSDDQAEGSLSPLPNAAFLRFVNAVPASTPAITTIGSMVENGAVFFRNSLATSVDAGQVRISAGGASHTVATSTPMRTLVVYAPRGDQGTLFSVTSPPLRQIARQSDRRTINATADVDFITVTYDTLYSQYPDSSYKIMANIPFGETSDVYVLSSDRRGSMYFYDSQSRKLLFTLPINIGPMGNSYSMIVAGRKEIGYEVIVLQEF
ncbi:MAG: hypothetical protein OKBPIBMD_00002 [Chlorobi bacterium]|nr:MAG: hypothetical protein UZ06_CHB003002144 [Chlorobi bacterium OLB6]MBV6462588.1 hypothetical protein [Chlorobiota bacterium]